MGVVDSAWWSVWWPWMLLWLATLGGLLACGWIVAVEVRRARAARDQLAGVCFYLHEQSVMDLYQVRSYRPALRQEVQQRVSGSKNGMLRARIFGAETSVSKEVFRRYVEEAAPITVIGTIMEALRKADVIVYADLRKRQVTDNRALRRALAAAEPHDAAQDRAFVRMRDLDDFVSVSGRFRQVQRTESEIVFTAPYGRATGAEDEHGPERPERPEGAEGAEDAPRVRIVCATDGLRTDGIPGGTFQARCLGKVLDWDPATRELGIEPIAIFR